MVLYIIKAFCFEFLSSKVVGLLPSIKMTVFESFSSLVQSAMTYESRKNNLQPSRFLSSRKLKLSKYLKLDHCHFNMGKHSFNRWHANLRAGTHE